MRRFFAYFSSPTPPYWRYCLLAFPFALIPSMGLLGCAYGVLTCLGVDLTALDRPTVSTTVLGMFGAVVFAPLVESLILAATLGAFVDSGPKRQAAAAVVSGLAWGGAHALFAPIWFFGTVWSFFVFSTAYLTWRKVSFRHGYFAAVLPHALINLTATIMAVLKPT